MERSISISTITAYSTMLAGVVPGLAWLSFAAAAGEHGWMDGRMHATQRSASKS